MSLVALALILVSERFVVFSFSVCVCVTAVAAAAAAAEPQLATVCAGPARPSNCRPAAASTVHHLTDTAGPTESVLRHLNITHPRVQLLAALY